MAPVSKSEPKRAKCAQCRGRGRSNKSWIECTQCGCWIHTSCSGLSRSQVQAATSDPSFPWLCRACSNPSCPPRSPFSSPLSSRGSSVPHTPPFPPGIPDLITDYDDEEDPGRPNILRGSSEPPLYSIFFHIEDEKEEEFQTLFSFVSYFSFSKLPHLESILPHLSHLPLTALSGPTVDPPPCLRIYILMRTKIF